MALLKLYIARDAMEAHYLRSVLAAEGIAAAVLGENLSTARGELPLTPDTLPSVWIDDEDMPRAQDLLAAFTSAHADESAPPADAWLCPQCGQKIEGQFDACWHCGAERE